MTQAFLNYPTIEQAHEQYLKRWHLESVKSAWNGRKPSLAQFSKRFGKDYERRQKWLAKQDGDSNVATVQSENKVDGIQQIAEQLLALLGQTITVDDEPEVENLGQEIDEDEAEEEAPKFVKPENFDELPRSGQVYFFLHRAIEAGYGYALVPVKRGIAAEAISQIKDDGRSYVTVAKDLLKSGSPKSSK